VPIFFAVMGMMVNVREIMTPPVLIFGGVYTLAAVLAKVIGCGGPALLLGFNAKGALRIGAGMVPRGEVALIIAGIGISTGILDSQLFGVIILMTLITTLAAPPLLSASLKIPGTGTRKAAKEDDSATAVWEFYSDEIADLVIDNLLKDLRAEGFYVQMMNINEGLSQARKDDIALSITENESTVTIETAKVDMPFVKTAIYEVILQLSDAIQKLKDSADPQALKRELSELEGRTSEGLLALIRPECVSVNLKAETKDELLVEMVDILAYHGKLDDRDLVLRDVLEREKSMSTGMQNGIALPHAKTDGVSEMAVAVGIKKEGIAFDSMDGEPSRIFVMIASPKKAPGPHIQFLAAISAVLKDEFVREEIIGADSKELAAMLLQRGGKA
jgi:fructose-specific phosphotransferase system IIA component